MSDINLNVFAENEREVIQAIVDANASVKKLLVAAVEAGSEVVEKVLDATGPGDGNAYSVVSRKESQVVAHIGPDKDHWHYRFFETGVQHDAPILPKDAKALRIGDLYRASAQPAGFPARPFIRPAGDSEQVLNDAAKAAGEKFKQAIP